MKEIIGKYSLNQLVILLSIFSYYSCTTKTNDKTDSINIELQTDNKIHADTSKYLKEKDLINYIETAPIIKLNKKNGVPFDTLSYNKVIAYDFDGMEELYPAVIKNGHFIPVILKQQYLTQEQTDKILDILTKKSAYGGEFAACFMPQFGIVFFNDNEVVNQINVAIGCNYLISDIEIPAQNQLKVDKGKESEYSMFGFSKSGKDAIIYLCKELNFRQEDRFKDN